MPRLTSAALLSFGGACLLAPKAFVPSGQTPPAQGSAQLALRGARADAASRAQQDMGSSGTAALVGVAAVTAAVACRSRTVLRAEPISAAAAAAAVAAKAATAAAGAAKAAASAKAASAAAGAAKTAGAVAGSAGTGSLAGNDYMADDPLANEELKVSERGTARYEAIRAAKQKRKEKDWEIRTGRDPDGFSGSPQDAYKGKANLYDPLMSLSDLFLEEADSQFNPAWQIGMGEPLGYFDPLGFCKKGDEKGFRSYRAAEIKHGRVAMMAAVGAVVQHYVKFPGFEGVPSGLAAVNAPPGSYGFIALVAISGALELGVWTEKDNKAPGDFGDPLGLNQYNEDMRNRELNNGRAAMFAAIGILAAELLTGKDAMEQLGL